MKPIITLFLIFLIRYNKFIKNICYINTDKKPFTR